MSLPFQDGRLKKKYGNLFFDQRFEIAAQLSDVDALLQHGVAVTKRNKIVFK